MSTKNNDQNAKDPDRQVPVDVPGVKPGAYDKTTSAPGGKQNPNG